ncbi:hypothetical protein CLF_101718 [Clonorchis sinensis]|uniref:Uncharacterized protein n=1 Tax=Clonorchis sinensis TaxID=79923 RepID=G7Y6E4_CLOSI|nr:hypothetical protein CLF_101718 [Clonorchis sinensis]
MIGTMSCPSLSKVTQRSVSLADSPTQEPRIRIIVVLFEMYIAGDSQRGCTSACRHFSTRWLYLYIMKPRNLLPFTEASKERLQLVQGILNYTVFIEFCGWLFFVRCIMIYGHASGLVFRKKVKMRHAPHRSTLSQTDVIEICFEDFLRQRHHGQPKSIKRCQMRVKGCTNYVHTHYKPNGWTTPHVGSSIGRKCCSITATQANRIQLQARQISQAAGLVRCSIFECGAEFMSRSRLPAICPRLNFTVHRFRTGSFESFFSMVFPKHIDPLHRVSPKTVGFAYTWSKALAPSSTIVDGPLWVIWKMDKGRTAVAEVMHKPDIREQMGLGRTNCKPEQTFDDVLVDNDPCLQRVHSEYCALIVKKQTFAFLYFT